jgi:hypothetical protein
VKKAFPEKIKGERNTGKDKGKGETKRKKVEEKGSFAFSSG